MLIRRVEIAIDVASLAKRVSSLERLRAGALGPCKFI